MAEKIVIASGKGGVGKSTLSAALSRELHSLGRRVMLFDMDIGLRSLDMFFGVEKDVLFDWGNVLAGECRSEQAPLAAQGISLMNAPLRLSEQLSGEKFKALVGEFDNKFDYIIFDAPAGLSEGFLLSCAAAERGIVVSTPDEVCVRGVNITASGMRRGGIENIRLIINRFDERLALKERHLSMDEVIDSTGVRLIGIVPEDGAVAGCCVRGDKLPQGSVAREAVGRIARRLEGENVPLI